jgi:nucleoside 2-deoxyribosyltransferase
MSQPRVYLAGPEVFLPNAPEIGARKKMLCEEFGFVGLFPLDNEFPDGGLDFPAGTEKLDEQIFAANVALMRSADAGIFNLSPFRGDNADPGTAFELGFICSANKPVFAYTNHAEDYFDRVSKNFGLHRTPDGVACDADALLIENFGNADNLMLDAALKQQGRVIVRPSTSLPGLDDLAGFSACLRQAKLHFGF